MFWNDNWLKDTIPVAWYMKLYGIVIFCDDSFCCITVSAITRIITCIIIFLIA